jgi:hypothetical protein
MVPAAFENLMTRGFCNSHCLSQFAAFFLVMGTKISTVENLIIFVLVVDRQSLRQNYNLALMILPQVHLRKPCYDFSFL